MHGKRERDFVMPKFFVSDRLKQGGTATITGDDGRHIARILRMGPGDILEVVDSTGKQYSARIRDCSSQGVILDIINGCTNVCLEPLISITVLQGLPKGNKMDKIVRMNTEIGVSRFVPVITERSIPRLEEVTRNARVNRWRRIAREASKQSGRQHVPEVYDIIKFNDAMKLVLEEKTHAKSRGRESLILLPWELETSKGIKCILKEKPGFSEVLCFIGPEGGFSHSEVEKAVRHGANLCTLGPRILRTETCAIVLSSIILYEAGEMR